MVWRLMLAMLFALASSLAHTAPLGPDGAPGRVYPGKFIWFDLATENPAGARSFYGAVFGWRFREVGGAPAGYTLIENANGKVGGLFRHTRPAGALVGSRWLSLISSADPAKTAEYVRQHGGQVILGPVSVPGRGTHAVFRDPQGAVFGVLSTKDGDPPDDPVTDGDVFWLDLFTPDPSRAAAFYAGLAGYEVSESETAADRKRWILATNGIARAGIVMLKSGTIGPGWLPYILVEDVPGTLNRARAAGGKVVVSPRPDLLDGNVAVIADPDGGVVGIVNWVSDGNVGEPVK
jgi:hypothetical protein